MTIDGSYIIGDFVVLDTSRNPKAPIILGRPFLHPVVASIYVASANMHFDINGKREDSLSTLHTREDTHLELTGPVSMTLIPLR